jgi:uncharacterized protein (UPF0147 family)
VGLADQTLHYVRSLENKIRELEQGRAAQSDQQNLSQKRPEAIIRALQLLEVREQLDRAQNEPLVREMYNKVLKKLEDSSHDN